MYIAQKIICILLCRKHLEGLAYLNKLKNATVFTPGEEPGTDVHGLLGPVAWLTPHLLQPFPLPLPVAQRLEKPITTLPRLPCSWGSLCDLDPTK